MAGNAGVIQAEISVQIGTAIAQLNSLVKEFAKVGQSAGAGMRPANEAVGGLAQTFKDFRKEQIQEGRLVGFYAKELGEFTGMSSRASDVVGGLGQTLLAAATGGLSFGLAFEGAKLAVTVIRNVLNGAKEEAEKAAKAIAEIQARINAIGKSGRQVMLERIAAVAAVNKALADAGAPSGLDDEGRYVTNFDYEAALVVAEKFAADHKTTVAGLVQYEAKLWEEYRAADNDAAQKAAIEQAQRQEEQRAAQVGLAIKAQKTISDQEIASGKKATDAIIADRQKRLEAVAALGKSTWDAGEFPDLGGDAAARASAQWKSEKAGMLESGPVFGPGNNAGEMEFLSTSMAAFNAEQAKAIALGSQWGQTLGNAIGGLIDGTASLGQVFAQVGQQIIAQLVEIAIQAVTANAASAAAGAASSQAGIPIVGPILAISAMGAILTAVLGLVSGIGGRALGGPVVPGGSYLVGERGPELLRVGAPGYVTGSARAGRSGGATTVNVSLNISALDGQSVYRTLTRSREQLARVVREAVRDGAM